MRLHPTQLTLLRSAAAREDHLLACPEGLSPRAAKALAAKLIRFEIAELVTVTAEQPCWGNEASGPIGLRLTPAGLAELRPEAPESAASSLTDEEPSIAAQGQPRPGTKQALVLALLRREQGATLEDLIGATGWLPHSTRAALTGLRKRGYSLSRDRNEDSQTFYRLAAEPAATAAVAEQAAS
ncbi:DUF3489 domain-containing protein [Methylobacterium nigriterrae]|uniref:DUF3489 domain-containing protein n=1 Tax=Methylobacterium nigriterrae TaxID=3127512 RepID=UPI0030139593